MKRESTRLAQRPFGAPSNSRETSNRRSQLFGATAHARSVWIIRAFLLASCIIAGFLLATPGHSAWLGAACGLVFAAMVICVESWLRTASLRNLFGALIGLLAALAIAYLVILVLSSTSISMAMRALMSLFVLVGAIYTGLVVGGIKGDVLNLQAFGSLFSPEQEGRLPGKILDTSTIIDGRIADIADAQFIDGTLLVPRFVLRELQTVADSADGLKRQRGRRGLEVLQRIQKMPHIVVRIIEDEVPEFAEVDMKLIEVARRYEAKVMTNDFNLNKFAKLQGVEVLNVNELANAMRPVVLPGETMRVLILREGKELNQGVAYLDDGTMVVVDGARKFINRTLDITVTSVHQTTAGKMIFGRFDEHAESASRAGAHAAEESSSVAQSGRASGR